MEISVCQRVVCGNMLVPRASVANLSRNNRVSMTPTTTMRPPPAKQHRRRARGASRGVPRGTSTGSSCTELSAWLSARYRAQEAAARDPLLERNRSSRVDKASSPEVKTTCATSSDAWLKQKQSNAARSYSTLIPAKDAHASFLAALRKAVAAQAQSAR